MKRRGETTFEPPKVVRTPSVLYIFPPLRTVLRAPTACTFSTSEPPKVARICGVLCILTWKCASRHNGVHCFNILTAKSGPELVCFIHFDLEMCFAPQRHALFQHLNFQKWSENGPNPWCFLTCWLPNVLRATTACNFSSHLASWLRTRRLSEPTLRPSGAPNHWENTQYFAIFLPFRASASAFFWLFLFYSSFFWSFSSLCLFPALLFICPYCRKFNF